MLTKIKPNGHVPGFPILKNEIDYVGLAWIVFVAGLTICIASILIGYLWPSVSNLSRYGD